MGAPPEIIVHRDPALLAVTTAERLVISILDAQAGGGDASIVLTGGGIGVATLRAMRDSPIRDVVDWHRVDVWWGDERFVPAGSPDRNEGQARAALLDILPLDPSRVLPMAASGSGQPDVDAPHSDAPDVDAGAAAYARRLAARAPAGSGVPVFDVLLLGMGPDGHVASIFPGSPDVDTDATVVAVRDSPKPPPARISLTLRAIAAARQVWVLAAGEAKADAVARAFAPSASREIPAVGARGTRRTLWLLDAAAASQLSGRVPAV